MNLTIMPNVTSNKTKTEKVNKQQSFGMNLSELAQTGYKAGHIARIFEGFAISIAREGYTPNIKILDAVDNLREVEQPKYELCDFSINPKNEWDTVLLKVKNLLDGTILERLTTREGSLDELAKLKDDAYVAKLMDQQRAEDVKNAKKLERKKKLRASLMKLVDKLVDKL